MMFMYKNDKDNIDAVKTGCLYFKVKIVWLWFSNYYKIYKKVQYWLLPSKQNLSGYWLYCKFGCNLNYFYLFCFVSGLKMLKGWQIVAIIFVLSIWHCSANTRTKVSYNKSHFLNEIEYSCVLSFS
jgi:hypothetical protein